MMMAQFNTNVRRVLGAEPKLFLPAGWGATHYLGILLLFFFLVEVGTGVLLMAYYRPLPAEAYASVWWTMNDVHLGAEVRQIHARGADLLLALIFAHLATVLWRQAYRYPHRLTWAVGVVMMVVALAFAFTGMLLPWNQVGYWMADGARRIIGSIPLAGGLALQVLWGGSDITDDTLLRFYVFHVGLLPWAMVLLIVVHLLLVWAYGLAGSEQSRASRGMPLVPDFVLDTFLLVLFSAGVVLTIAILAGVPVGTRADPLSPVEMVVVPWYFAGARAIFQRLPPLGAMMAVGGVLAGLILVPFLAGEGDRSSVRQWIIRVAGLVLILAFTAAGIFSS